MTSPPFPTPTDSTTGGSTTGDSTAGDLTAGVDDGFIDGLASLDSYFRVAPESPAAATPTPVVAATPVAPRRASRQYCEGCREEIDAHSVDNVTAVQQLGGHPPMWGLPRTFHLGCWDHHEGAYRRT